MRSGAGLEVAYLIARNEATKQSTRRAQSYEWIALLRFARNDG
jgi:hypothetical protein